VHFADQRLDLGVFLHGLGNLVDLDEEEFRMAHEFRDLRAALAFDQHLDGAVGELEHLHDVAEHADAVDVVLVRLVGLRVFLRREENRSLFLSRFFQRFDRPLPADE
jgi:hypothetical protein